MFILSAGIEVTITVDFEDEFYMRSLANTPLVPIVGSVLYYILQMRELKRFLECRDSE